MTLGNMPTSVTGKTSNILPGLNEQPETGKNEAVTQPEPQAAPGNIPRKARVKENLDSDYAEVAEDFFYDEGM